MEIVLTATSGLLEDIIKVFLTVRGFAVARVLRNKLSGKQTKQPAKHSNSLRQVLKTTSKNWSFVLIQSFFLCPSD